MATYVIVQIDPEQAESWDVYYNNEDAIEDHIWIGGNRDFTEVNKELGEDLQDRISDAANDIENAKSDIEDEVEQFKEIARILDYFFGKLDHKKKNKLLDILDDAVDWDSDTTDIEIRRQVCELMYDEPFETTTLRGYSQGDWAECIYPAKLKDMISFVESVFFATGEEFILIPIPFVEDKTLNYSLKIQMIDFWKDHQIDGYSDYCADTYSEQRVKDWAKKSLEEFGVPEPVTNIEII